MYRETHHMSYDNCWLELKEVEAWHGSRQVFEKLSLNLKLRENTLILGPNGAGKSALVKLICRSLYPVVKPNSALKIFGSESVRLTQLRSRIGVVSTELELRTPGYASAIDIVMSGMFGSIGIGRSQKPNDNQILKVSELMKDLGLSKISKRVFAQLSDGERRRLLIARALVNNPDVLVLDEPIKGLDLKARHQTLNLIRKLSRAGTTILMVTHQIESIVEEIQRVIFLKDGILIGDGAPKNQLKSDLLSRLFETPLEVIHINGYWQVLPGDISSI